MSPSTSGSSKWERLFSIAVVLMLIGAGALVVYAANIPKSGAKSSDQSNSQFYTEAANTLAAIDTSSGTLTPVSTPTPFESPTATGFPQYVFTPQDTVVPVSPSPVTVQTISSCNNSSFVSDVSIPDGTILAPGQSFVKTWAFQNTGTCTWTTNYQLVYTSGEKMGGATVKLVGTVSPTQQDQVSVSLVAPVAEGTYTGFWRLADDQGNQFGVSVFVKIVVSNTAPTITPTGTLTTTRTITPVSSSTSTTIPSATSIPIASETPTPSPTATFTVTSSPETPSDTPTEFRNTDC